MKSMIKGQCYKITVARHSVRETVDSETYEVWGREKGGEKLEWVFKGYKISIYPQAIGELSFATGVASLNKIEEDFQQMLEFSARYNTPAVDSITGVYPSFENAALDSFIVEPDTEFAEDCVKALEITHDVHGHSVNCQGVFYAQVESGRVRFYKSSQVELVQHKKFHKYGFERANFLANRDCWLEEVLGEELLISLEEK